MNLASNNYGRIRTFAMGVRKGMKGLSVRGRNTDGKKMKFPILQKIGEKSLSRSWLRCFQPISDI